MIIRQTGIVSKREIRLEIIGDESNLKTQEMDDFLNQVINMLSIVIDVNDPKIVDDFNSHLGMMSLTHIPKITQNIINRNHDH